MGQKLIEDANDIPETDWINVDLKKEKRKINKFKMYERTIKLPWTNNNVRQVIFKCHGMQVPIFLITNNFDLELETLALHYVNRWLIENKFSELFDFFNLNALSSPLMIRIYFDVVMTIVEDTLYRLLTKDLKRFEDFTHKHGSCLNMAENELNVLNKQCLNRIIGAKQVLIDEIRAWEAYRNERDSKINWQFTISDV